MKYTKPTLTYGDLKEQLAKMTPEQLAMKARVIGDERGFPIQGVWILDEDYVDVSGDGLEPKSRYSAEDLEDELCRVEPIGTPFLLTDDLDC
jgi:hypothetical protein